MARPATEAFERLLEAMPDAIVVVDGHGRVVRANRLAETLSGYSREDLLGMAVEQLVPEALRRAHVAHRAGYQRDPTVRAMGSHLDIRFRRRDGSQFPADIALNPVATEQGVLVVASVRDITERRRAEEELLQAQQGFRLVVEGVHDYAIFMLDPEGRVRTWSPAAARIAGYTAGEVVGRHFSLFYPPEDVEAGKPARELLIAAETGRREEEGWRVRKDRSRFWANAVITAIRDHAGKLVGFAEITRDVTERKRQDDRLRAVVEVAQAALRGRPEAELLGLIAERARSLVEAGQAVISLDDGSSETRAVAAAEDAGAEPAVEDVRALVVPLASGERTIGRLTVAARLGGGPFTNGDGELLELFAAQAAVAIGYTRVRDELERFAVLEDRERIGRELHDGAIQSLFAVGMGLQGMAMMTSDPALRDRLEGTVGRIDDVIRDLRNYIFGLRPGLAADRHLATALQDLAEELEQQHGVACAVEVEEEVAARLAPRAADIVQMTREALSNVARHAAAATCRLSLRREGAGVVLEVDDDGQGFVPGAEGGGGWGLRNLGERATAMGGSLDVQSVPGGGTTLRVRLPA